MADVRTERTDFLGLLALMMAGADSQNWSYPYWNVFLLDAFLNALTDAPRTGVASPVASLVEPTVALSISSGSIPGGISLDVVQTLVDEYGRETEAGPVATIETTAGITDPAVAGSLENVQTASPGFEGGLLEVWHVWTDGAGGETLPSPVATVDLPFLSGGLLSQVDFVLPETPASAGAFGANIYVRHRSGNVVLAYRLEDDTEDTIVLDSTVTDCYRSAPLANSTASNNAIDFSGAGVTTDAVTTRFYIKPSGADWTSGDWRVKLGGVDEFDIATVSYPLTYSGQSGQLVAGFPPTISQVKAIRPVDLETEVTGILPLTSLPGPETAQTLNETVTAAGQTDFTIAGLVANCEIVRVRCDVTGGASLLYDFEMYEDAGRTVLAYKADTLDADLDDRIPFIWLGGATAYCRIVNNDDANITDADTTLTFRR